MKMHAAIGVQRSAVSNRAVAVRMRGFTVIELMVVVGIIVMLVGLIVSVSVILHAKSESRQVEQTFKLLDMALQEWELSAERQITYGTNDTPPGAVYEVQEVLIADAHELTHRLIDIISRNSEAKNILSRINPAFLKHEGDELTLFDPWGSDVITVFPGRVWKSSDPGSADPDSTVRTPIETAFGVCDNRRVYFVSAGPDSAFGDLHLDMTLQSIQAGSNEERDLNRAADNLYSYPPLMTRP